MKILAVISSPNHEGKSAALTKIVCNKAAEQGAEIEYVYLFDLNFKGCGNCEVLPDDPLWCNRQDDLVPVMKKLIEADAVVWSFPIHMDYMNGAAKTFFDRFCIFINPDFTVNRIQDKKFVLISTCGAPAKYYAEVVEKVAQTMKNFFKLDVVGTLLAGETMPPEKEFPAEIIARAKEIGAKLC